MTTLKEIFPSSPNAWDRFANIARKLNCDVDLVEQCFSKLPIPEWTTSEHLDAMKANATALNAAATFANNLRQALEGLNESDRQFLTQAGHVTLHQIARLATALEGNGQTLLRWSSESSRRGGRNPAAHTVAFGIRRVFRKMGWPVTFGQVGGQPSTEFGRAVQFAIGEFGIQADWKNPASIQFHKDVAARQKLANCRMRFIRQEPLFHDSRVDVARVAQGRDFVWIFTIRGRQDITPMRLSEWEFRSGADAVRLANAWAKSVLGEG